MNTRHAQIVLTIARFGSITAAAKALYLTQPTLSATLKQIESQLGEPIFVRGRTPMELTPAGELYVHAARRIIQIETQLSEAIGHLQGRQEGVLHLGVLNGRSDEMLPQVLPEYMAEHPGIRIEVTEGSAQALEQMLVRHELDAALLCTDAHRQELAYRQIASEEMVLLAGKKTAIAQRIPSGSTISLDEAAHERFIAPAAHLPARRMFDSLTERSGLHAVSPALTLDNMEAARRICASCSMVMLSPYISLLCDTPAMQQLAHYHLSGDSVLTRFSLVYPADTPPAPYAEDLFSLVAKRFRAMSAYRLL